MFCFRIDEWIYLWKKRVGGAIRQLQYMEREGRGSRRCWVDFFLIHLKNRWNGKTKSHLHRFFTFHTSTSRMASVHGLLGIFIILIFVFYCIFIDAVGRRHWSNIARGKWCMKWYGKHSYIIMCVRAKGQGLPRWIIVFFSQSRSLCTHTQHFVVVLMKWLNRGSAPFARYQRRPWRLQLLSSQIFKRQIHKFLLNKKM